jgi:hypothetical protein
MNEDISEQQEFLISFLLVEDPEDHPGTIASSKRIIEV